MRRIAWLAAFALVASPAAFARTHKPLGLRVAHRAGQLVGHKSLREVTERYSDDCSGFVRYVYARSGVDLQADGKDASGASLAAGMYRRLRRAGVVRKRGPRPGDLVFFRDTWDRNGDGRRDDGITHVGVVESVHRDGRITFVHRSHAGIVRSRLDLAHRRLLRDGRGRVHNDVLRRAAHGDHASGAGELLAGFAAP
jgi:hypothetical protein